MGKVRAWSKFDDSCKIDSVKQKLRSYRTLVSKHKACTDLYDQLFPSITQVLSHDKIQSTGGNATENKTVAFIDLRRQMTDSLQAMQDEISGIISMIQSLPADEYTVIMRRYTLNESMETISEKTFISIAQCWRMHESAVRRMAEMA